MRWLSVCLEKKMTELSLKVCKFYLAFWLGWYIVAMLP